MQLLRDSSGYMKTEMYCDIRWNKVSELATAIQEHIDFYNNQRIKMPFDRLNIEEHHDKLPTVSEKQF